MAVCIKLWAEAQSGVCDSTTILFEGGLYSRVGSDRGNTVAN